MPLETLPAEFLFSITVNIGETAPVVIGGAPFGTRIIVTGSGGTFEGPKMRGVVAQVAGGDWVTLRADGVMDLDVRIVLTTDDGVPIFMRYTGVGKDGKLRTAVRFEVGDERYSWLNAVQAVSHGATGKGSVSYDVYALS